MPCLGNAVALSSHFHNSICFCHSSSPAQSDPNISCNVQLQAAGDGLQLQLWFTCGFSPLEVAAVRQKVIACTGRGEAMIAHHRNVTASTVRFVT